MQRQPQDRLIVVTHQFLEGGAVPALRLADEDRIVYAAFLPSHAAPRGVMVLTDFLHSVLLRVNPCTNRKCYCQNIGRHVSSCPLLPGVNAAPRLAQE